MLGMPYLLLATVGYLVYRAFQKAQAVQVATGPAPAGGEGASPCPPPSRAAGSSATP